MSKPAKSKVDLPAAATRPSRIRRDPVRTPAPADAAKASRVDPSEWETWVVALGVLMFALAISIVTIGISEISSW